MARALLRFRKPDSAFWIRTIIFSRSAPNCARSASPSRSASSCIRPGRPRGDRRRAASRELVEAMLAYDLIGFQTEEDARISCLTSRESGVAVHDGIVTSRYGKTRAAVFPIASIRRNSRSWR